MIDHRAQSNGAAPGSHTRSLRILCVIDSLARGGAERSLAMMARPYVERGVHLDVAYLHDRPGLQAELEQAGAGLYPLPASSRAGRVLRLRRLIRQLQPDLIHTTLYESDLVGRTAARMAGVPVVSSLVNVAYGAEQFHDPNVRPGRLRAAWLADIATARLVRRFHAVSQQVADVMGRKLRIPQSRIDVVPRGRDPKTLGLPGPERRMRARAELGIDSSVPLVLAAARQEQQKGLDVLLEAFPFVLQGVPDARLVIAGREGNLTTRLQEIVASSHLGERVRFLGARTDVPDLLCAADVCVIPSRWEGLGGVFLEAMALEAPIVATDMPSFREVANGDHAPFVPPEQPIALAEAIVSTLTDRESARRRARHARARFVEAFTLDPTVDRMLAFYDRALARR